MLVMDINFDFVCGIVATVAAPTTEYAIVDDENQNWLFGVLDAEQHSKWILCGSSKSHLNSLRWAFYSESSPHTPHTNWNWKKSFFSKLHFIRPWWIYLVVVKDEAEWDNKKSYKKHLTWKQALFEHYFSFIHHLEFIRRKALNSSLCEHVEWAWEKEVEPSLTIKLVISLELILTQCIDFIAIARIVSIAHDAPVDDYIWITQVALGVVSKCNAAIWGSALRAPHPNDWLHFISRSNETYIVCRMRKREAIYTFDASGSSISPNTNNIESWMCKRVWSHSNHSHLYRK